MLHSADTDDPLDRFLTLSRQTILPVVMQGLLGAEDAVIAPEEFYRRLTGMMPKFAPRLISMAEAEDTGLPSEVRKALVLAPAREWRLIRRLRRWHQRKRISSIATEILPLTSIAPFRWQRRSERRTLRSQRILLMSTPMSDGEYVAGLMEALGYARPREYVMPAHVALAGWQDDFSMAKVLKGAAWWAGDDRGLGWHLQSDVLFGLAAQGALDLDRFFAMLKTTGTKIVLVTRQDHLFQASLMASLDTDRTRSIWHVGKGQRAGIGREPRLGDLLPAVQALKATEKRLASVLQPLLSQCLVLKTEYIATDPDRCAEELTRFLGNAPAARATDLPSFHEAYDDAPRMLKFANAARRDLLDRLSLRASDVPLKA